MKRQQIVAIAVASALALGAAQTALVAAAQQTASIAGTAKDEASTPYTDYSVRAREVQQGQVGGSTNLDQQGNFSLPNLASGRYVVELVNKDGRVVCTEGPFNLNNSQNMRNNVVIDCDKVPAAWWLLGAAAAAGVTAGIVAAGPASPAQ